MSREQRSNITAFGHFGHIRIYGNLFQHTFCHITYILPYNIYMVNVPYLPYKHSQLPEMQVSDKAAGRVHIDQGAVVLKRVRALIANVKL